MEMMAVLYARRINVHYHFYMNYAVPKTVFLLFPIGLRSSWL
jgi:hypothetical protein